MWASKSPTVAPRAMITGAAGLIGQYLVKPAPRWAPVWDIQGLTRADLDLTDRANVERTWQSIKPNAVIHCAALSRPKVCERDPEQARRINAEVTAHLAQLSQDIPFIFVCSGEVFDGSPGRYGETSGPNPIHGAGQ